MRSSSILDAALSYADQGASIVLLKPKAKRPIFNNWQRLPRYTPEEIERAYKGSMNIGVRLGAPSKIGKRYLQAVDMDIRDRDNEKRCVKQALGLIEELFPELVEAPRVISGSGGGSRHIYFLTDEPFSKINLGRADYDVDYEIGGEKKRVPAWECDLYGTGSQVVLPPSIHPNGNAYRWDPEFPTLFED